MSENKDNWVTVTKVANDIEYEMVAGLLEMGGIPSVKRVKGVDGFLQVMLGVPLAGIDVLVPPDRYEEAQQLLTEGIDEESLEEAEAETEGSENQQEDK